MKTAHRNSQPIGIIDENGYERVNRVYHEDGLQPAVCQRDYKDPIKVLVSEEDDEETTRILSR